MKETHVIMPFFLASEMLPENNEYVLVHLVKDNWRDSDDPHGKRYWKVAKFVRGVSNKGGNNLVQYRWEQFGPGSYFGQEVDVWARLPILGDNAMITNNCSVRENSI